MSISVFQLFTIGIGPSSSHTVGPMRAARQFMLNCEAKELFSKIGAVRVDLYGSLALTGKGHATDTALLLGLEGFTPEEVDPAEIPNILGKIRHNHKLMLLRRQAVPFSDEQQIVFHRDKQLPYHPNGMRFTAFDGANRELYSEIFYSVGGGFVIDHATASKDRHLGDDAHELPMPFATSHELLSLCKQHGLTIAEVVWQNELSWHQDDEIRTQLFRIWEAMRQSIVRGCQQRGILPGGIGLKRRAGDLFERLTSENRPSANKVAEVMEWLSLWALAVCEENAAGSRVVTAPTNGAAGIIPSVLQYYCTMTANPTDEGVLTFLLTAGAIGILYKEGASISAAEMGCMGEVGVACSMAAAGLTAALGGTNAQVENAAEIGMEHNLGLTCDPVRGLVQIPCIERNTMGAVKAVNACLLALQGDGSHFVSLDQVIATMRETGLNMRSIYKETSQGGLAVNVPEC